MANVLFIHNIIAPYRIPLFDSLSNEPGLNLHFAFCAPKNRSRLWDVEKPRRADYSIMPGHSVEFGDMEYHINPSVIEKISAGRIDTLILGGTSDFTTQISLLLAKIKNIPVIIWSEGTKTKSPLARLARPISRYGARSSDAIIVPGRMAREYQISLGASSSKIFTAPNAVDNVTISDECRRIAPTRIATRVRLGLNRNVILFVGQLIKRKGLDTLLSAYELLKADFPDTTLVVIGDGVLRQVIQEECHRNGIRDVRLLGWVPHETKIMYYALSDLFVFPTHFDVWGLVLNEAMAAGLPVISTSAAGASPDLIVEGENGYVIPPKNVQSLYKAMKDIIENRDLALQMGRRSFDHISSTHNYNAMSKGFVDAIEYVIERNTETHDT